MVQVVSSVMDKEESPGTIKSSSPARKEKRLPRKNFSQLRECSCVKPAPKLTHDRDVQTGLELNIQYAADILLAELNAP